MGVAPDCETELGQLIEVWVERIGIDGVIEALDFYTVTLEQRREVEVMDLKSLRAFLASPTRPALGCRRPTER